MSRRVEIKASFSARPRGVRPVSCRAFVDTGLPFTLMPRPLARAAGVDTHASAPSRPVLVSRGKSIPTTRLETTERRLYVRHEKGCSGWHTVLVPDDDVWNSEWPGFALIGSDVLQARHAVVRYGSRGEAVSCPKRRRRNPNDDIPDDMQALNYYGAPPDGLDYPDSYMPPGNVFDPTIGS